GAGRCRLHGEGSADLARHRARGGGLRRRRSTGRPESRQTSRVGRVQRGGRGTRKHTPGRPGVLRRSPRGAALRTRGPHRGADPPRRAHPRSAGAAGDPRGRNGTDAAEGRPRTLDPPIPQNSLPTQGSHPQNGCSRTYVDGHLHRMIRRMIRRHLRRLSGIGSAVGAALTTASLITGAVITSTVVAGTAVPAAAAQPCPDVQVVFARGTGEPPGVGPTGQAFIDALRPRVGDRSLDVYAVNYPAIDVWNTGIDGIRDAGAHVVRMAEQCPDTRLVLGGFSQGAAVMGFVTSAEVPAGVDPATVPKPLDPDIAEHVAAVVLFGMPNARAMNFLGTPPVVIGPLYEDKTVKLCAVDDPV